MEVDPPPELNHSSDPRFLAYYERESVSQESVERFRRIRARALELWAERNSPTRPLEVVDIGCGAGTQALLWAELGHTVRALDVNEPLISIGRERALRAGASVRFEVGTAAALPFADESADVCLLPELLEHISDWETCLTEAVRVLRPGGLIYLSTTNRLCPIQEEFDLPFYSWYPSSIKRYFERLAVTTRPSLANFARYPAVNWFTFFQLRDFLRLRGFECLDRFDVLARQPGSLSKRLTLSLVRANVATRFIAHVLSLGTTVWAWKRFSHG